MMWPVTKEPGEIPRYERPSPVRAVVPFGAGFLSCMPVRSLTEAIAAKKWSLAAVLAVGVVLMLLARFAWQSPFFSLAREPTGQNDGVAAGT
jgi:hypothetical protein